MLQKKWQIIAVCLAVMICFAASPALGQEKVFKWRMATAYTTGQPLYKEIPVYFSELVKKMSNNRLQIQIFPSGAVVPPMEIGGAVRKGTVQMGAYWPGWDIGVDPTSAILGGFAGGMNSELTFNWLYAEGGAQLWTQFRRERFEVHALPGGFYGTETFLYAHKPINSLDDIKGMKIRCAGIWADILSKMGASTVTLPTPEVLPALERKVIDATELTTPGGDLPMGFHEIAKYVILPGAHQPSASFEIQINLKMWEELPADLKAIIESAAMNTTLNSWVKHTTLDVPAIDKYKQRGNIVQYLPVDVQKRIHQLGREWVEERSAKFPWLKKVYDSMKKYMDTRREFDKMMTLKYD
jgi:TRAP-type mannitol/chloroaromatic compound transport system substrate-binding protein